MVVDLRTGETKEHQKSDYITKIINHDYNPAAKANKWNKFVRDVMGNDDEMVDYVHRVLGYSVNGSTDEQCLFIFYGEGANGKSTLSSIITDTLWSPFVCSLVTPSVTS